nr:MBL fold metallo-hydrolase [Actinopolymorpha pittospori]
MWETHLDHERGSVGTGEAMGQMRIGAVEVDRAVEWYGPLRTVGDMFPGSPEDVWRDNADWLSPDFWNPVTGRYNGAVQTWVLRGGGRTILVDTGVGNDRDRPQAPALDHLATDFLDRLAAAGVRPSDVDVVVNTHIHYDHVGWNTHLDGGTWTPTFPNATYLVPRADYDYFHPANAHRMRPPRTDDERARFEGIRLVFADSIEPVERSGQLRLWENEHRVDETIRLEAAPGHTPGSSVLWVESAHSCGVFVGDLLHSPVQILHPEVACTFDLDADQARVSRRRVLDRAASMRATVFPGHFGGAGAASIVAAALPDGFTIAGWAPFPAPPRVR